jgi:uncharacterized protein (TIGR02677 family)
VVGLNNEDLDEWPRAIEVLSSDLRVLPGQMSVVRYLVSANAPFYRVILDVLLEEESRLGLHLATAEIVRRLRARVAASAHQIEDANVAALLDKLYRWGNLDRIQNGQRKTSSHEYLKRDYLFQLTTGGARVHRSLTEIDVEMGVTGALQSSMLPEVLAALQALCQVMTAPSTDVRAVHAALLRVINGFGHLSENARLFVQGLNRSLELDTQLDIEIFLAYKHVVVEYMQIFVVALNHYASRIADAIEEAERLGVTAQIPAISRVEAAPTLGMSPEEVVNKDSMHLLAQWEGLRRWFFGDRDREPIAQILQDRAADAVNRIVATVRRIHDQRFRRHNRASDLLTLAAWFAKTTDREEAVNLWRSAFGMYSARHLGAPHPEESDVDVRAQTSWWASPAAPIDPRLQTQGPRATVGKSASLPSPNAAKRQLAARQAHRRDAIDQAVRRLATGSPIRLSQLDRLTSDDLDTLLACLTIALSAAADSEGARRARTSDGRLAIVLRTAGAPDSAPELALVQTEPGDLVCRDFELTINDLWHGMG